MKAGPSIYAPERMRADSATETGPIRWAPCSMVPKILWSMRFRAQLLASSKSHGLPTSNQSSFRSSAAKTVLPSLASKVTASVSSHSPRAEAFVCFILSKIAREKTYTPALAKFDGAVPAVGFSTMRLTFFSYLIQLFRSFQVYQPGTTPTTASVFPSHNTVKRSFTASNPNKSLHKLEQSHPSTYGSATAAAFPVPKILFAQHN